MRRYQEAMYEVAKRRLALKVREAERMLECDPGRETPLAARALFPPLRQPSQYSRGTMGETYCYKAGGLVPHESALERDFYSVMEWDYTVDFFVAQACRVPYRKPTGDMGSFFPDCLVFSDKPFKGKAAKYAPTVYEIKSNAELDQGDPELLAKLDAAATFLKACGLRFQVLNEVLIDPTYLENIKFLLGFCGPRFFMRKPEESRIVAQIMRVVYPVEQEFTPEMILKSLEGLAPREQIIPWIWNLYSDYVFQCDLLKPLSLQTKSWRCGDAGDHMANCGLPDKRADWRQPENDWRR